MKKMRSKKGITLVALVITIIVLLILAVVAIGAVRDSGIIGHAQNSADRYNSGKLEEESMLGEYEDEISKYQPGTGGNGGTLIEDDKTVPEELYKYLLGDDGTGRDITKIFDGDNFISDENDAIPKANELIQLLTKYEDTVLYIKYNNAMYEVISDANTSISQEVNRVYTPQGREGTRVKYDSDGDTKPEEWIIINDREYVEIASVNPMYDKDGKEFEIAMDDIEAVGDLDKNGVPNEYIDKCIYMYNDFIRTINNFCKSIVREADKENTRSFGADANYKTQKNFTPSSDWFKGELQDIDSEYKKDLYRLAYFGVLYTEGTYFIASRYIEDMGDYISLGRVDVDSARENFETTTFFCINKNGSVSGSGWFVEGVRPIIKNPSSELIFE